MGRAWVVLGIVVTVALAGLCLVVPAGVALADALRAGQWADAGLSVRRIGLLWRGVYIALAAALLSQVLGAGLAAGLAVRRPSWVPRVVGWLSLVVLLTPPYIYAYAWSLPMLPEGINVGARGATAWPSWMIGPGRAVWCLATWCCPVAAFVLHSGWRAAGRGALQLAVLDASPLRATLYVLTRVMAGWLAVSTGAVLLLAMTEYAICHLCLVQTWNTEVLSEVLIRPEAGQALLLAWPLVALLVLVLAALWPVRAHFARLADDLAQLGEDRWALGGTVVGVRPGLVIGLATALVLIAPWVVLISRLRRIHAFVEIWRIYACDWADGLCYAVGAALIAIMLAIGVDFALCWAKRMSSRAWRTLLRLAADTIMMLAVVGALMPPALVGDAFAAAFGPATISWLPGWNHVADLFSRSWLIVSFVGVARYGVIAILALRVAGEALTRLPMQHAESDGASWRQAYVRVRLPMTARLLLSAGMIVGLLSFTEVAATQLVRPPNVDSVAITLLNAIHYGRDDQIIAMCLYLMVFVAIIVGLAGGRSGGSAPRTAATRVAS